jgi:hypothetical protein
MEGCVGSQQLLERRRRSDKAPTVESMGGKSQGQPARCDIFLTFATINSFPMRRDVLPDIEAAQEEATRTLTDLVREAMRGESAGRMAIEVRSQHGPVLEASLTWRLIVKS